MSISVQGVKGNAGGYARGYMFYVLIPGVNMFLARSSSLPAGTIEEITVPWQGMDYKIGGPHTYAAWSATINDDIGMSARYALLGWQKGVHDGPSNVHGVPAGYMQTVVIQQLNLQGVPVMTYRLKQAWPSEVGEVSLDYGSRDVTQFDVTITYNYYEVI